MLRRLFAAASVLAAVPLIGAWIVSERVIHPKPKAEDHGLGDFDLPARDVTFSSRDGTRLAGWYIPPTGAAGPAPGILLAHGHGRSRAELLPHADFLHRAGFAILSFDFRNRGESDGDNVTMGLLERGDLLGALDELAAKPEVDAARLGVLGMSMGGVATILAAGDEPRMRAIVVESPYATQQAIMTRALRHYYHVPSFPVAPLAKLVIERRLGEPLNAIEPLAVIGKLSPRPVFIIANEADAVVGHEEAARLLEAAGDPKQFWLIPEADHARGWQAAPEEYERRVVAFFREALAGSGAQVQPSEAAFTEGTSASG